ncbi:APC family permease [Aeromicrobium panaciterrae]|uniref:APC family permease n=1 Tax=Aeromicrobium panaciterrae TaxID=363861 RepID=UPI0031E2D014
MNGALDRRLGLTGSVAIGMSAMIGAGLFVAFGPATAAAGDDVLIALAIAAVVAACNAASSARLAARYPSAGGTYVYGRERLGPFWGYLAGWAFIAGKLASCAAMAYAIGTYVAPEHAQALAVIAVAAVVAINLAGVEKSAFVAVVVVAVVVTVVAVTATVLLSSAKAPAEDVADPTAGGVLHGAALLFFAFAGYARLATLGEEVRDPRRTIPRAMALSLVLVGIVYAVAALALLHALGGEALADSARPFVDAAESVGQPGLARVLQVVVVVSAAGALLSLTLGVSRTTLAMARDRHLPRALARVSEHVPRHAELFVGALVIALVLLGNLSTSIAFSSFCVLLYYAITNASAWTLSTSPWHRTTPVLGLIGCGVLALNVPMPTIGAGCVVLGIGVITYVIRTVARGSRTP